MEENLSETPIQETPQESPKIVFSVPIVAGITILALLFGGMVGYFLATNFGKSVKPSGGVSSIVPGESSSVSEETPTTDTEGSDYNDVFKSRKLTSVPPHQQVNSELGKVVLIDMSLLEKFQFSLEDQTTNFFAIPQVLAAENEGKTLVYLYMGEYGKDIRAYDLINSKEYILLNIHEVSDFSNNSETRFIQPDLVPSYKKLVYSYQEMISDNNYRTAIEMFDLVSGEFVSVAFSNDADYNWNDFVVSPDEEHLFSMHRDLAASGTSEYIDIYFYSFSDGNLETYNLTNINIRELQTNIQWDSGSEYVLLDSFGEGYIDLVKVYLNGSASEFGLQDYAPMKTLVFDSAREVAYFVEEDMSNYPKFVTDFFGVYNLSTGERQGTMGEVYESFGKGMLLDSRDGSLYLSAGKNRDCQETPSGGGACTGGTSVFARYDPSTNKIEELSVDQNFQLIGWGSDADHLVGFIASYQGSSLYEFNLKTLVLTFIKKLGWVEF
ncbi:MAG: hypothetical protein ABH814_00845 [bacterium]